MHKVGLINACAKLGGDSQKNLSNAGLCLLNINVLYYIYYPKFNLDAVVY